MWKTGSTAFRINNKKSQMANKSSLLAPRSRYYFVRKVPELPMRSQHKSTERSCLASRATHQRNLSENYAVRYTPTPNRNINISNYSMELKKALNFIKKPEKIQLCQIRKFSEIIPKDPTNYFTNDEAEAKEFIDSIFLNKSSIYRKSKILSETETIDLTSADKILQEARKIIRSGYKKKNQKLEMLNSFDNFWQNYISTSPCVRWDTFEDFLISYIQTYLLVDLGSIRKLNWGKFLMKLYLRLSKENIEYSLWISTPCCPKVPEFRHRTISKSDLADLLLTNDLVMLMVSCIDEIPALPIRRCNDVVFTYICGCKYKGQWKEGMRYGDGILELCSSEVYQGTFSNGIFQGFGTLKGLEFMYKGHFHKEKFNSFGKVSCPDGGYYEGILDKGKLVMGSLVWKNGDQYKGEFHNNQLEGKGVKITADGDVYEGMWCQNEFHGEGTIKFLQSQIVLSGVFINNFLNEKGKLSCPEYTYSGEFEDSVPHGIGKFVFLTSKISYKGEVEKGVIQGKGLMTFEGKEYFGTFANGTPNGIGKFTFADGDLEEYEGEVENGGIDGVGLGKFRNGNVFKGLWSDGIPQGKNLIVNST